MYSVKTPKFILFSPFYRPPMTVVRSAKTLSPAIKSRKALLRANYYAKVNSSIFLSFAMSFNLSAMIAACEKLPPAEVTTTASFLVSLGILFRRKLTLSVLGYSSFTFRD